MALEVTLYRRANCGLCDQAEAMLLRIQRRVPIRISLLDIDTDPELQARYFLEVPVVAVAGREVARAPLTERVLQADLEDLAGSGGAR